MAPLIADLKPPYYAVIFSSQRRNTDGYQEMAERMNALAAKQKGYLGVESIGTAEQGITISYWTTHEDIQSWKRDLEHLEAQKQGRGQWYGTYQVRLCKVERSYGYERPAKL